MHMGLTYFLHSIADKGRDMLSLNPSTTPGESIKSLCNDLLSRKGEASGVALGREIITLYASLDDLQQLEFFYFVNEAFAPDPEQICAAASAVCNDAGPDSLKRLARSIESPRQELFRRINMAPDGTSFIVSLRSDLNTYLDEHPDLCALETDLQHLLNSWFNRGFLVLKRIDWHTPAIVLEKLIAYEAVHEFSGWKDLRRRLADDRRCFAFFHPALQDEPLIFVQVALVKGLADRVQPFLDHNAPICDPNTADTAIFYSISNCQKGLRGKTFGHFLLKQVITELISELPTIKYFATLSPIPGFRRWLKGMETTNLPKALKTIASDTIRTIDFNGQINAQDLKDKKLNQELLRLCAHYLVHCKHKNRPLDPVARFHLGNGARLERINWLADTSEKGIHQSLGIMVNYVYPIIKLERNHEAFVNKGKIIISRAVQSLL
jgi:malonyl-CoA decarboxylase